MRWDGVRQRTTTATVALLLIVGGGCDRYGDYRTADSDATAALPSSPSAPLRTWADQFAAAQEGSEVIEVDEPVGDLQLQELTQLPHLRKLSLENNQATPEGLLVLHDLPNFNSLKLKGNVGDEHLRVIGQLTNLRFLNLPQADFTDAGLKQAAALPELRLLRLGSPHITDAGLAHLKESSSLRFLHLIDTPITDQGLQHIRQIEKLQSFYLDGSQATEEGLGQLMQERPRLHLHINQRHLDRDPQAGAHQH